MSIYIDNHAKEAVIRLTGTLTCNQLRAGMSLRNRAQCFMNEGENPSTYTYLMLPRSFVTEPSERGCFYQ